jgi:hypothetical protein
VRRCCSRSSVLNFAIIGGVFTKVPGAIEQNLCPCQDLGTKNPSGTDE